MLDRGRNFVMSTAIKTRLLGSQSDEKLLELARDRSQTAWQTLARRHHSLLLRHCRGLCLSEEMAQEVVRRALSEAWRGIEAGAQPRELRPWLHRIAHWIAVEELEITGLLPGREGGAGAPGAPRQSGAAVDSAPKPDELLALRGALRAMTPDRSREGIVVHRSNGNKAKVVAEDAFEFTDSAVRGLLGRARRGISALTPPPLLAWAMGRAAEGGAPGERMAELGASGGAAGIAGLALKGGLAAITAGVAITGAVIAQSKDTHSLRARHHAAAAQAMAVAAGTPAPAPADAGVGGQRASGAPHSGAHHSPSALKTGQMRSESSTTSQSSVTPASTNSLSSAPGPREQSTTSGSPSTTSTAGSSGGSASASAPASPQSPSTPSGSESEGHGTGIGVQISAGSGSGQQTPSGSGTPGSAGSTSSSSETSKGIGVGVSVSLEPLGSVGVHVSLP